MTTSKNPVIQFLNYDHFQKSVRYYVEMNLGFMQLLIGGSTCVHMENIHYLNLDNIKLIN